MTEKIQGRGITARSFFACIFAMVATALCVQFYEIIEASANDMARVAIPVGAMVVFIPLLLVSAFFSVLTHFKFLNRAELLAVLFCSMMTAPFASSGFWMMLVGPLGTIPKTAFFEVYDAFPSSIWPHSDNVLSQALVPESDQTQEQGNIIWEQVELDNQQTATLPVLLNNASEQESSLRLSVPLSGAEDNFSTAMVIEEPYLLSLLMRPSDLGPDAEYFCRIYTGGKKQFDSEIFAGRALGEKNYLHPQSFLRRGIYGFSVPRGTKEPVEIEIGLTGKGRLEIADAELLSVGALDAIYRGRRTISQTDRTLLPAGPLPQKLLPQPDNWLSLQGLRAALEGNIPWRHWFGPFLSWYTFGALLLIGILSLGTLLYRQWIENERYPLPNTRIPVSIIGSPDEKEQSFLASIWSNRIMWIGCGVSLFWCLMKGWHAYNSNVPDMNIQVDLSPYFTDPAWGKMWKGEEIRNVTFQATAILVSLAIFMELNVIFSLVLGFFLFRFQYLLGEMAGLAVQQEYPYYREQQIGAFLIYGLLILFFARGHLWRTIKSSLPGGKKIESHGPVSYRGAWLMLLASLIGIVIWTLVNGMGVMGLFLFFVFLLLVSLVAMKLRAECGLVTGWFGPVAVAGIIPLTGGMWLYEPQGVIFVCIASYALFQYLFFLTPGMQIEMMELGRKYLMSTRQILALVLLASLGGLLIAGWVHLSLGFGVGGDNYTQRWPYMDKTFILHDYNKALADANLTMLPEDAPERLAAGGFKPNHGAYLFGGGVTLILSALRQLFSGFWFHPIGFIVGSSPMMEIAWGSVLAAGIIRYTTFRLGGSHAVRTKLMPFFAGVFIGAITAYLVFAAISGYLYFYHPEIIRKSFGCIF